jgi:hypothetical protein
MKPVVMLLMLSFSLFAQNDEVITIDQTGAGNSANAQTLNLEGYHLVTIIQEGNYNGTEYDLTGDGIADPTMIIQDAPEARATIEEYGNRNSALIHQVGSPLAVGSIYQEGNRNVAILRQGEEDNLSLAGRAGLYQYGNNNRVEVDQPPEYNDLVTSQTGNRNTMIIYQDYESVINPVQDGDGNMAHIKTGVSTGISLSQYGSNNYSDQYQELRFYSSDQTTESVYQEGHCNTAYQFQQKLTDLGDPSTAEIIQCGTNNYASQTQIGPALSSRITQTGTNNRAESYQNGVVF